MEHREWTDFAAATFDVVGSVLGASRMAIYLVDAEANLFGFECRNVPAEFHRRYTAGMFRLDPLHMSRMRLWPGGVAHIADASTTVGPVAATRYRSFLRQFQAVDTIELLLRRSGRIEAGMSVMWTETDRPPGPAELRMAADLQRYVEFTFDRVGGTGPGTAHEARSRLTARESEIVTILCRGRTNQEIADRIGVRLSTVKTHLLHVFEKFGVQNRAELVARMSGLN